MEGVALDHSKTFKPSTINLSQFHPHVSDESDQDARNTTLHIWIILWFIIYKGFISSLLATMWDHTDGCAKQYICSYDIYLLSCIYLECFIIIDRAVDAPVHGKYTSSIQWIYQQTTKNCTWDNLWIHFDYFFGWFLNT